MVVEVLGLEFSWSPDVVLDEVVVEVLVSAWSPGVVVDEVDVEALVVQLWPVKLP